MSTLSEFLDAFNKPDYWGAGHDEWPTELPIKKTGRARGSPNAALKLARDFPAAQLETPELLDAVKTMPTATNFSQEANMNMISMTGRYKDFILLNGRQRANFLTNVSSPVKLSDSTAIGRYWTGSGQDMAYGSSEWRTVFGGDEFLGDTTAYLKNDSKNRDTANHWKVLMTKIAVRAGVNPVYFTRFAYERLMGHAVGIGGHGTAEQWTSFAKRYLGFAPGSDWRDYPPYITKY